MDLAETPHYSAHPNRATAAQGRRIAVGCAQHVNGGGITALGEVRQRGWLCRSPVGLQVEVGDEVRVALSMVSNSTV